MISSADRTQVLCSNILQQLNSSLNEVKGLDNVNGFRSLMRAFAYYKELEIEIEDGDSIESQARSTLQYLKLVHTHGCKHLVTMSDIHACKIEK
jgi:hypothetical protein